MMLKLHENGNPDIASEPTLGETSNDLAVEVIGLTKRFGRTTVVDNLSLAIPRGAVYGLIGPNGAGKSTTLKSLMRLLKPSGGKINVLGQDIASDFQIIKNKIGYVPEIHNIYRWMKIGRVIEFTRSFYPTWNDDFCSEMMELLDLPSDKKVKQLSKGMLAKLGLLLAVSHEPELLILDEPLSGLDPIVRDEFIDGVLKTICERDTTVIFSSHTIGDIQRLANQVGVLFAGRLLVNGSVNEILDSAKQIRVVTTDERQLNSVPNSTIYQKVRGREVLLTVSDFSPVMVEKLRQENELEHVSVDGINLEDFFKACILGERQRIAQKQKGERDA